MNKQRFVPPNLITVSLCGAFTNVLEVKNKRALQKSEFVVDQLTRPPHFVLVFTNFIGFIDDIFGIRLLNVYRHTATMSSKGL